MRLDFNNNTLRLDRKWARVNGWQKYVEEEVKYVIATSTPNMRITDAYWVDDKGNEQRKLDIEALVTLYVKVDNPIIGKTVDLCFTDSDTEGGTIVYSGKIDSSGIIELKNFRMIMGK